MASLTVNIIKGLKQNHTFILLLQSSFPELGNNIFLPHLVETVIHPENSDEEPQLLEVQFFLHILCFLIFKFWGILKGIIDGLLTNIIKSKTFSSLFIKPVKQVSCLGHVINSVFYLIYCQSFLVIDIKQVEHLPEQEYLRYLDTLFILKRELNSKFKIYK